MQDRQKKLARIRLIARTRMAWEQVRTASTSSRATSARTRFAAFNRALALLALQP
jgi:hypothetical protein